MISAFAGERVPSRWALALCSLLLLELGGVAAAVGDDRSDVRGRFSFSKDERKLIDEGALWGQRERRNRSRVEAFGNAYQWLVSRTPLPVDEEMRRAATKDEVLRTKLKTADVPPVASAAIFRKLIAVLPARMRPKDYEFTLTAIEQSDVEAFSLGAGRIYVDARFLNAALDDKRSGTEQVAFVLAHELGHLALGHARRVEQRLWVKEQFQRDADERRNTKGKKAVEPPAVDVKEPEDPVEDVEKTRRAIEILSGVGAILEHVYSREDQFEADLFAIHLCRNAGFDVENCLDALRRQAVRDDGALLQVHPPRTGNPPIEPEVQRAVTGEALTLADHPNPAQRLRRLRLELDGLIYGDAFGLFEFDPRTKTLKRAADRSVSENERVVICIHGMESSLQIYLPLMIRLAGDPAGAKFRILGFQYPNDDSLARSGLFLQREVQRIVAAPKNVDFVCHSAGGLVFRYYAEVARGDFHHAYFQGTPHAGSDLAALRSLLEATQFIGDLKLGYDAALQQAILDGHGQMSHDLQPDSLFLSYLNAPREGVGRDRCTIYRGQASSRTRVLLIKGAVETGRVGLERLMKREGSTLSKVAHAGLEKLVVPAEIANGDMAVTLDSAGLAGVDDIQTYPRHHTELPRNPEIIEHLVQRLVAE